MNTTATKPTWGEIESEKDIPLPPGNLACRGFLADMRGLILSLKPGETRVFGDGPEDQKRILKAAKQLARIYPELKVKTRKLEHGRFRVWRVQ